MNSTIPPDPSIPVDADVSPDLSKAKPKASKGSRFWSLVVGLLLAAALVLFALDRLGVRLPTTGSLRTSVSTGPGEASQVGAGSAPSSDASPSAATVSASSAPAVAPAPAKPVVPYAQQQDQIQALIGQVQGLPSLAQPPNLTPPAQPQQAQAPATAPQASAPQEPVIAPSTSPSGSASPVQDPLAGPSLWSRLSDSLSELFVVRRLSPSAQPMLDEAGDRLARQELRLLLLSARMSLMMDQSRQARADLLAAQGLLPKFFRTEDSAVQAFAERLTAVLTSLPGQP
ncbi:MAG: HemX, putative uroporphyrinogen-III C-methyltransferase [Pseudomonadota bacterium]